MMPPPSAHEPDDERTEREDRELLARRLEEARIADRDRRLDLARAAVACFAWATLGIAAILWSAHTTNTGWGRIAFFGGVIIGNGGIIFTLLAAWRRGERRGDW